MHCGQSQLRPFAAAKRQARRSACARHYSTCCRGHHQPQVAHEPPFETTRLLMDTQLLLSPKWWAEHCASLPEVFSVERQQGEIRQKNSFIQFLLLRLFNGQDLSVVAKLVNLAQNQYRQVVALASAAGQHAFRWLVEERDEEHRARSVQSYRVETSFFQKCAPLLLQAEVRLPAAVYIRWEPGDAGLTVILQDLRALPAPGGTSSLTVAPGTPGLRHCQFHALTQLQAEAALAWLARFHAAFWGAPVAVCAEEHGLWCQGGYWTLEKRQPDLHRMPAEWRRTVASFAGSFPQVFQRPSVQALGVRLAAAASRLHAQLGGRGMDSTQATKHGSCQYQPRWTLLHGDFKTANIFLAQAEGQAWTASACDYQWTGGGLGVRDVVYLIWTSVEPSVAQQHEQELLHHYWDQLNEGLRQRNAAVYTEEQLQTDADVAFLDYTRFLIGSMWGNVSPESCSKMAGDMNQGMHKRSAQHLVNMVHKADQLLQAFEQQRPANMLMNTIREGVSQPHLQAGLLPSNTAE